MPTQETVKAAEAVIVKFSCKVEDKVAIGLSESDLMEVPIQELDVVGFKIVSRNSGGRPTAFVARFQWSFLPTNRSVAKTPQAACPRLPFSSVLPAVLSPPVQGTPAPPTYAHRSRS